MPLSLTSDSPSHSCGGFLANADAPSNAQHATRRNCTGREIRLTAHLGVGISVAACFARPPARVGPRSYRLKALYVRSPMSRCTPPAYKSFQAAAVRTFGGCIDPSPRDASHKQHQMNL